MSLIPFKHDLPDLIDTPQTFSGVAIVDAGNGKIMLPNEVAFFRNTFRLNTEADESGLAVTGFIFIEEVVSLTELWGRPVYRKIQITDAAYQSGTIYAFGDVAGSVVGALDINRLQDQIISVDEEVRSEISELDTELQTQITANAEAVMDHEERVSYLEDYNRPNFIANPLNRGSLDGVSSVGEDLIEWSDDTSLMQSGALRVSYPVSGTGRYLDIALKDLNAIDVGRSWFVRFAIKLATAADDLLSVVLFDGTTEIPTAIPQISYSNGMAQIVGGAVLPSNVLANVTLRIKIKDNAVAEFYLADVSVGPQNILAGAAVGATQTYPLTIGATTTAPTKGPVVTDMATWSRRGDKMLLTYSYEQSSGGSPGSGTYTFSLPNGYRIDLTKQPIGSTVGYCKVLAPTVAEAIGVVVVESASLLRLQYISPTSTEITIPVGSSGYGLNGSRRYGYVAEVPIAQWTSNVNLASDFQEFAFNTQAAINTNDTTSFGYGSGGTPILANTADLTYYDVSFTRPIQPTDLMKLELRSKVDGSWIDSSLAYVPSLFAMVSFQFMAFDSSVATFKGVNISRVAENKVRVQFFSECAGKASVVSGGIVSNKSWAQIVAAADGYDRWRVRKISNGNMAEVPPLIHLETGDNAAAASGAPIIWSSKVEDPYNMLNLSTGIITVPLDGLYDISIGSLTSNVSETEIMTAAVNNVEIARVAIGVTSGSKWGTPCKLRVRKGDQIKINHSVAASRTYTNARMTITRIGS